MYTQIKYLFFTILFIQVNSLKLEQVLILGRHNIRTPLTRNLDSYTPLHLPQWDQPDGYLTSKGAILESYFGEYFKSWLNDTGVITSCPKNDSIYIYANGLQRTRETAKIFAESAFKDCNVPVYYKKKDTMDPIFNPILRNDSDAFKKTVENEMMEKLNSVNLTDTYRNLNEMLNFKQSKLCIDDDFCDLTKAENAVKLKVNMEPEVLGPLSVGIGMADLFIMSYYNGLPLNNIGWGKINTDEDWDKIYVMCRLHQNVRFNTTTFSKHAAKLLIGFIKQLLEEDKKFILLVGHDSNLNSVMKAIGVLPYVLIGQGELLPVGGKLVFQKWLDNNGKYLFRLDYVYQTMKQIRDGSRITLNNSPIWKPLDVGCEADDEGFCLWDDFMKILNDSV